MKIFACVAMALIVPFSFVGCDKEQVEENTKTVIETGASIIPVEYKQETAEGILKNALQNLLSSSKVKISGKECYLENGIYSETASEQKTMIKDGKRYTYFNFSGFEKTVLGMYDNKLMVLDLENKTYTDITPVEPDPNGDPDEEVAVITPLVAKLDLITSLVNLSDNVVSGRYFDGVTYINIKVVDADYVSNIEVKIINGNITGFETMIVDGDATGWAEVAVTYNEAVDVSVIPTTLDGFTVAA